MKKQKSKKTKKAKRSKLKGEKTEEETWVDEMLAGWTPLKPVSPEEREEEDKSETLTPSHSHNDHGHSHSHSHENSTPSSFGIISWNVLAESYCSPRSHSHLPMLYQRHVFDRKLRQRRVRQTLTRMANDLAPDFLALQEVDAPLAIPSCLKELGYEGHTTPTDPSGKNGRMDSCALFFRKDTWMSLDVAHVRLDDLSTLSSNSDPDQTTRTTRSSLQGIQTSFVRKNMALLVRLKHLKTSFELTVAVLHLFWNPLYQDVKLCQAHHVAARAKEFAKGTSVIVVGDTNSKPKSAVHEYFTKGVVDARKVAPWYRVRPPGLMDSSLNEPENGIANLTLDDSEPYHGLRYLLDFSLNRLCRWLRIMGIDAEIETEEEERQRTKHGNIILFARAKREHRALVTASTRLIRRKDCPPGTYLLDTRGLSNLEVSLVHLLLSHGVVLEPSKFLTRCVVCNSPIKSVTDEERIQKIFETHQAPGLLNEQKLDVFQCSGCGQGYWYNDQPNSSASRVKNQATRLLEMCIRGGVPIAKDMGMFSYVNVEEVKNSTRPDDEESLLLKERLDILEWLQQDKLQNPLGICKSAYCDEKGNELLPFTNVTHSFVGHLDYIFHDVSLVVEDHLHVPTTNEELNTKGIPHGHLLPSHIWPSDHLAIGATFQIPRTQQERVQQTTKSAASGTSAATGHDHADHDHANHDHGAHNHEAHDQATNDTRIHESQRIGLLPCCDPAPGKSSLVAGRPSSILLTTAATGMAPSLRVACACAPKMPSLFEMAELRRQAKLKKAAAVK